MNIVKMFRQGTVLSALFVMGFMPALASDHDSVVISNPLIWADVPDNDYICVGKDYYMVSTTMHLSPGCPVMHSRDMKHWEIVSYVFDQLHEGSDNDLVGGNVYGKGQWAASLKYHKGLFYVFFGTGRRSYLYSAKDAKGPWTLVHAFDKYYHDAAFFFDDDDKAYLVYGSGKQHIKQFNSDLSGFDDAKVDKDITTLNDGCLLEGSHMYKHDGYYYITQIWWPRGGERTEVCWRSHNIAGPYEHKVILSDNMGYPGHGIAQGGIFQASNGEWYGFLFQDHEAVGRIPYLAPCRWVDGWPMLGDTEGKVPQHFTVKHIKEQPLNNDIVTSDEFSEDKLKLQWQWNHNPENTKWSLNERKGWLRLHTVAPVKDIFEARNTISQRTFGPESSASICLDVSKMKEGDHAGISTYCSEPGTIEVVSTEKGKVIRMTDREKTVAEIPFEGSEVYFKADCDFKTDNAKFYYSLNGTEYKQLGNAFHMVYNLKHFMGNRFSIFNYATKQTGGYVDIDYFRIK